MSVQAMAWVLDGAPGLPAHLLGTLMAIANAADNAGRNAWPSQQTIARQSRKTVRAVRKDLLQLELLGLLQRGDQRIVMHIRPDRRPVVWDLPLQATAGTALAPMCAYCGKAADSTDHVVPRSRGGTDDPSNLVPSCTPCNSSKRDLTLEEWIATGRAPAGLRPEPQFRSPGTAGTTRPGVEGRTTGTTVPTTRKEPKNKNPPTPADAGARSHRGQHKNCRACGTNPRAPRSASRQPPPLAEVHSIEICEHGGRVGKCPSCRRREAQ